MFDNIGGKIKGLAKFICWVGIIASVVLGIVIISGANIGSGRHMYTDSSTIIVGVITIVAGSILSWVGSFVLYGFGELVENSSELVDQIDEIRTKKTTTETYRQPISPISSDGEAYSSQNQWTCPKCGRRNPITLKVCNCGTFKPE